MNFRILFTTSEMNEFLTVKFTYTLQYSTIQNLYGTVLEPRLFMFIYDEFNRFRRITRRRKSSDCECTINAKMVKFIYFSCLYLHPILFRHLTISFDLFFQKVADAFIGCSWSFTSSTPCPCFINSGYYDQAIFPLMM